MKKLFVFIFFGVIGILGIYYPIRIALIDKSRILLLTSENPLIIYSPVLSCISMSLVILAIPILFHLGLISSNYFHAKKYEKAKSEFIVLSLSIPAWFFLFTTAFSMGGNFWILIVFICLLLIRYSLSLHILIKGND